LKIILFGYYGFRNLGDDLMLSSILDALSKEEFVDAINVVVRENYYSCEFSGTTKILFHDGHSIMARARRLSLLLSAGAAIWGGGTCLYEPESRDIKGIQGIERNVKLMKLLGIPFYFLGIGIGRIFSEEGHRIIESIIDDCAGMNFRDMRSFDMATAMGGARDSKFSLGGDLLFLLKDKIKEISPCKRDDEEFRVGFCGVQQYASSEEVINACTDNLKGIISDLKAKIILFPFHQGLNNDNDFHRIICDRLPAGTFELVEYVGAKDAISVFKTLDFVIGMRLHSIILADLNGIPNLAINYSPKVRYYVDKSGVIPGERLLEVTEVFHSSRIERVTKLYALKKNILTSFVKQEAKDADASVERISQLLAH